MQMETFFCVSLFLFVKLNFPFSSDVKVLWPVFLLLLAWLFLCVW